MAQVKSIRYQGNIYDLRDTSKTPQTEHDALETRVDDLSGLPAQVATIGLNLGDLSQLHTTDKTSLVNALNEVKDNSSTTAEDTTYTDTNEIGATNVQDALDSVTGNLYTDYDEEPSLGAWGRSSSKSAFTDNGGHNVTISANSTATCRIGFEVTGIGEGKELHISYDFSKTTANSGSWGIGTALNATWKNLTCKTGEAVIPSDLSGSMEFSFVIPEGTSYIFITAANFYDGSSQTIQITNFKAWTVGDIGRKIDAKADVEYVDGVRAELENEIELSKYSLSYVEDVWSTNDATVIYAVRDGDDVIVTTTSNAAYKRCGFDISSFEIGDKICVSYLSSSNIVWGVGNTLGSTFINVGIYSKTFMFTKTASTQKYLYIPANSYASTGVTLTLAGFNVYKAVTLEDVNTETENLKSCSFMPSSYIPIKETYERYMTVSAAGSGQGSTIYGDYFVQGFTYTNKVVKIYDLQTKELVQEVALPTFANPRYHSNTISFSGTKYDNTDIFPLLYICSGYTDSSSVTTSEVYVVRIAGTEGSFTTELVQTIYLDFGTWTEWVCDPVKNVAWINGSGIDKYICVAIPDISNSEVTIDANAAIIDHFNTKSFTMGTSTKSSAQGRFFYHGRVYYVSGIPNGAGEGEDSLYIVVDNTLTHCTEAVVPLKNFGLTSEPEGCFIWEDDFYVAYRGFIAKLIQN